jgi:hypothetical protein
VHGVPLQKHKSIFFSEGVQAEFDLWGEGRLPFFGILKESCFYSGKGSSRV